MQHEEHRDHVSRNQIEREEIGDAVTWANEHQSQRQNRKEIDEPHHVPEDQCADGEAFPAKGEIGSNAPKGARDDVTVAR